MLLIVISWCLISQTKSVPTIFVTNETAQWQKMSLHSLSFFVDPDLITFIDVTITKGRRSWNGKHVCGIALRWDIDLHWSIAFVLKSFFPCHVAQRIFYGAILSNRAIAFIHFVDKMIGVFFITRFVSCVRIISVSFIILSKIFVICKCSSNLGWLSSNETTCFLKSMVTTWPHNFTIMKLSLCR